VIRAQELVIASTEAPQTMMRVNDEVHLLAFPTALMEQLDEVEQEYSTTRRRKLRFEDNVVQHKKDNSNMGKTNKNDHQHQILAQEDPAVADNDDFLTTTSSTTTVGEDESIDFASYFPTLGSEEKTQEPCFETKRDELQDATMTERTPPAPVRKRSKPGHRRGRAMTSADFAQLFSNS